MKITVEIEPSLKPNLPNVMASATVTFDTNAGAIAIHDCWIQQSKNDIVWCSPPTFRVQRAARQFENRQTFELPASVPQQISAEALRSYEEWNQDGAR